MGFSHTIFMVVGEVRHSAMLSTGGGPAEEIYAFQISCDILPISNIIIVILRFCVTLNVGNSITDMTAFRCQCGFDTDRRQF